MSDEAVERWDVPGLLPIDVNRLKGTVDEFGETPEIPAHWPQTEPPLLAWCKKRPRFLPPDWGFSVKYTGSGRTLDYFITPEGKGYFHQKDIVERCGIDISAEYPLMDGLGRRLYWNGPAEPNLSQQEVFEADALERPDHWPTDTVVDSRRRMPWLPGEIGQGIKETNGAKMLQCYVLPDGRRYFHRKDLEKHSGYTFEEYNLSTNGRGDPVGFLTITPPEEQHDAPPAKRQKVAAAPKVAEPTASAKPSEELVQTMVPADKESGKSGFVMEKQGELWHVVPDDVLFVDVLAVGARFVKSGWSRSERMCGEFTKSGCGTLLLSSSGALNISDVDTEKTAEQVARQYVDEWLAFIEDECYTPTSA